MAPQGGSASFAQDRLAKARAAWSLLSPFFRCQGISGFRLQVYASVVQSILLYSSESAALTPSHAGRMDTLHFRILRQILGIKSSYSHRVLHPSQDPCSTIFLQERANSFGRDVCSPSQLVAARRQQLLGHILRHEGSLDHLACFMPSHAYRFLRPSQLRAGRPRAHWAELAVTDAHRRLQCLRSLSGVPSPARIDHL